MHGCMVCFLIGSKFRQLHFLTLACVGGCQLHELTLICEGRHLCDNRVGNGFFIIALDLAKDAKSILLVRLGGGIPVMSRSRRRCIRTQLESLLNELM
jgi:hypothetical protein